jgi:cyclic pyranopterin phosphate synthase
MLLTRERALALKNAGLDRVTISLDSLKRDVFKQMTRIDVLDRCMRVSPLQKAAALQPIKSPR